MCGLMGKFGELPFGLDVRKELEKIKHRGPDSQAVLDHEGFVHGHVRLAVIDLTSASNQPFARNDCVLSYNGELWNFVELRDELIAHGVRFETTGDTEVVFEAMRAWGLSALRKFDGIFAFAWSRAGGEKILVRDRFGEIPLYWQKFGNGSAIWCSERKGFPGGCSSDEVPAGSFIDLRAVANGFEFAVNRWYDVEKEVASAEMPADPETFIVRTLVDGVMKRMIADAPLCCLISGGIDSTMILSIAKRFNPAIVAYTAYLDPRSKDLESARDVCGEMNVELREVRVEAPGAGAIRDAIFAIESPMKAQIEISLLCIPLADRISRDGFKVCLSGEGADELFGGYAQMKKKIWSHRDDVDMWRGIKLHQLGKMSRGNFSRCNKVFMARGVECRLPFLERELVETVVAMDHETSPSGKKLLMRAANGFVPDRIIRRQKQTFQGASGMMESVAGTIANPKVFFGNEYRRMFGSARADRC